MKYLQNYEHQNGKEVEIKSVPISLIERIKVNEGFRDKPYLCSEGVSTIGYGFTFITEEESAHILKGRIEKRMKHLNDTLDWFPTLPPEVQGVVVEMTYQLGVSGFLKFKKAIAHMKNKEWQLAAHEMLDSRWNKQTPERATQLANIVREHG